MNGSEKVDYHTTTACRVDPAADGHKVVQMMFNSQNGDGSWNGNGGDCWLRILEFKPDGKTIGIRTFSPTRRRAVVENGVLKTYLHNRERTVAIVCGAYQSTAEMGVGDR